MKRFSILLFVVFSFAGYQSLALASDWSSDTQSVKVFLINWTCIERYNEEDGSLEIERWREQEIVIVQCDEEGNTIVARGYYTWRDGRDLYYEGDFSSRLTIARNDGRRGIIEIGDDGLVALAVFGRDGQLRAARGTWYSAYVDGPDSWAYIDECRANVRADRRLTRLLENELQNGQDFADQVETIIDTYLEDRGFEPAEF